MVLVGVAFVVILNALLGAMIMPAVNEWLFQSFLGGVSFMVPLLTLLALMAAMALLKLIQAKGEIFLQQKGAVGQQRRLMEQLLNARYYEETDRGSYIGRIDRTAEEMEAGKVTLLISLIAVVSTFTLSVVYIIRGSLPLFIVVALMSLCLLAAMGKSGRKLRGFAEDIASKDNDLLAMLWDYINHKAIAPYLDYRKLFRRYLTVNREKKDTSIRMNLSIYPVAYVKMMGTIVMTVIVALCGGYLAFTGSLDTAKLFGIVSLLPLLCSSLFMIPAMFTDWSKLKGMEKVLKDMRLPEIGSGGAQAAGAEPERLAAKGVSYRNIVKHNDFNAAKGRLVMISGDSGSGKTTLVRMLLGLLPPDEGRIELNGVDLAAVDPVSFRRSVFYMSAKPYIRRTSLREFLYGGGKEPDGYAALIGLLRLEHLEKEPHLDDQALSAGEIQKVFLAKMMLSGRKIWICDEPTSKLDDGMEGRVMEEVRRRVAEDGILAVFISHREKTLRYADDHWTMTKGHLEREKERSDV